MSVRYDMPWRPAYELYAALAWSGAALSMALFALSVGALSAFIYWATLGYLDTQTNAIIETEIQGLYEQYERSSLRGLADFIDERVQRDTERRSFYLLADAIGRRLAGNVQNWPAGLDDARGQWVDFVQSDIDTPVRAMLLRVGPKTRIQAHAHADDRVATVISGTRYFGYGRECSEAALKELPVGSVYTEPPSTHHFAASRGEGAVVQITGYGPSGTTYVDPANDPNRGR